VDDATLAMSIARCRIAFGAAAVVSPRLATRVMSGRDVPDGIGPLFARMLGARDLALGLGTVIALDRGAPVRGWVEGSALSDAVDFLACIRARADMSPFAFRASAGLAALTRRLRHIRASPRPWPRATDQAAGSGISVRPKVRTPKLTRRRVRPA
jgi:hypothetical protein